MSSLTLSTTNEDISLTALAPVDSLTLSVNGGNIFFETLNVGNNLTLNVKNGDISGTVLGSYEDYEISCEIKKGESNLPEQKEGGEKVIAVTANNGDVSIDFGS